jgi:hypothetical protein
MFRALELCFEGSVRLRVAPSRPCDARVSRCERSAADELQRNEIAMAGAVGGGATKSTRRNLKLPLAARARVGHIRANGAVAEWLKAAVC